METPNLNAAIREIEQLRCAATLNTARQRSDEDAWKRVEEFRVRVLGLEKALNAKNQALLYNEQRVRDLTAELKQKQESWDKAANYRDEVLKLRAENRELEKRINERYSDANYHMNALDRLAAFVKPKDLSSEGVVSAAINWINRLIEENERARRNNADLGEERDRLRDWKNAAMVVDRQIASIDNYVRTHPEAVIGDDVWGLVGKWLVERDYLKRRFDEIKKLTA